MPKNIESGACSSKVSEAHNEVAVGDIIGDPFKDIAGY
jgi:Na+/H+-translocating membrane pyrophosphatase